MSETKIETRVIEIDPKELKLLKENARFMRHEEFQRLVANIKKDGVLTSAPFAWLDRTDGKYEVLSGNHRVSAAMKIVLRLFEENQTQLADSWFEKEKNDNMQWVPVSTVLGRGKIPAGCAKTMKKALDRMIGRGETSSKTPWEGIEKLCEEYLRGE